jgi:hypothetical protein
MDDGHPAVAGEVVERPELYGSWRMVSARTLLVEADGTRTETEAKPEGVILFTPQRMMAFATTDPNRKPATNDAEALKLYHSMIIYSGRYRLYADRYDIDIDLSSTELNKDEPQPRYYTIEGDTLRIEVKEHPYIADNTKRNATWLVCEREK